MLSRLSVSGLWCLNGCDITENHSGPIKRLITVIRCISSVQYNYYVETTRLSPSDKVEVAEECQKSLSNQFESNGVGNIEMVSDSDIMFTFVNKLVIAECGN